MLKFALLGFLSYRPMSGYDMKTYLEHSTQYFWQAKLSQIYRTLKEMETEGLVISTLEEQEDRPDKRIYEITPAGKAEFEAWLATPVQDMSHHKDGFLLKVFFSGSANTADLRAELLLHRKMHQQQGAIYSQETREFIQQVAREFPEMERNAKLWDATRRFGERYSAMYQAWIDEVLALLNENDRVE